ncbi:MAG: ATP-binding protein [Verrucomicrobia bacterium]|jgi:hypothetical protein|nr:ATP-binding protein [Verrucomicrobiota bacterium]
MSNTRHAPPGTPLRQNKFASSPDIERGLLGNLVARRCASVEAREDRELLFWIQSRPPVQLANEVLQRVDAPKFAKAEYLPDDPQLAEIYMEQHAQVANHAEIARRLRAQRRRFAWELVLNGLPEMLGQFCLDPAIPVADGWPVGLPRLCSILRELKAEHQQRAESTFVHTALSRMVWAELQDAYEMGGTVLLHNSAGNGKSFAAKAFCDACPGRARYALLPATNDDVGFFRVIAGALKTGANLSLKAVYMRERILPMLRTRDLVLVLDAAQYLFPVSDYRYALPNRLNWVLTALSEQGVPVVLIGNTKLFDTLGFVEARTGWNRNQFVNQIRIAELPSSLEVRDVQNVAAALLPDGDRPAQWKLADYMITAPAYLHSGQPAAQRARRIAATQNRARVTLRDMETALDTSMRPALKSQAAALKRADESAAKCKSKVRNWRPDTEAQTAAKGRRARNPIATSSDFQRVRPEQSAGLEQPGCGALAAPLQNASEGDAGIEFLRPHNSRLVGVGTNRTAKSADLLTV